MSNERIMDETSFLASPLAPTLTGVYFRPASHTFHILWDGQELGECDVLEIKNSGIPVDEFWGGLFMRVGLLDRLIEKPELAMTFFESLEKPLEERCLK